MPHLRVLGKVSAISLILLLISLTIFAGAVGAEEEAVVMVEGFAYEVKEYPGVRGPGKIWYQYPEGSIYKFEIVYTDEGYVYKIITSYRALSLYGFGHPHLYDASGNYIGPKYYEFKVRMMLESGWGGILVRVQKGSDGEPRELGSYLAAFDGNAEGGCFSLRKLGFESETECSPNIKYGKWYYVSLRFERGNRVIARMWGNGVDLTLTLVDDDPPPPGGFGIRIVWDASKREYGIIYVDAAWLTVITPEAETVTTTITEETTVTEATTITEEVTATKTTTMKETTTVTETVEVGAEATVTETETVTEVAEVQTTTVTESITETITKMKTTTAPAETITETVTETATVVEQPRCLIATAAFGSELAPQVQALREFRDGFIMKTFAGRNFMTAFNAFYYSWSPYVARAEYENPMLRGVIRSSIYPLLFILDLSKYAAEPFSPIPELAALVSGLVVSSLIGLIYLAPPILTIWLILRLRGRRVALRLRYPAIALALGLMFFTIAELFESSTMMMVSSSMIVLSSMALAAMLPTRILQGKEAS